jgi:7,8-dihydropterin-6-yl-methyl-4-(beta-D-ribofuranosyl)aminobenzene 5'-phosphate synthase
MTDIARSLALVDSLAVDVLIDDVSDNYVSKTLFAVSEFANIVRAGAKTISAEALLCAGVSGLPVGGQQRR